MGYWGNMAAHNIHPHKSRISPPWGEGTPTLAIHQRLRNISFLSFIHSTYLIEFYSLLILCDISFVQFNYGLSIKKRIQDSLPISPFAGHRSSNDKKIGSRRFFSPSFTIRGKKGENLRSSLRECEKHRYKNS